MKRLPRRSLLFWTTLLICV